MPVLPKYIEEDGIPVNNAGGGAVDGIGIGPKGEPPVKKKKLRSILSRNEKPK